MKQKTGKTKFEKFKDIMKELGFETMYEDDDTFGSKITGFRRRSIPNKMEELVVYGNSWDWYYFLENLYETYERHQNKSEEI